MKHSASSSVNSQYVERAYKDTHQSSDGVHLARKASVLFADGDNMQSWLHKQLVKDIRPPLNSEELQGFVDERNIDIAIASNCEPLPWRNCKTLASVARNGKCGATQRSGRPASSK